jgi:hypothetical protein
MLIFFIDSSTNQRLHTLRYSILNKYEGFKIAPKTGGRAFNTSLTQHAAVHLTAYIVSSTCLYGGIIGSIIYLIKSKKRKKEQAREALKQQFQFETLHAAQQAAQEALLKEVEHAKSNREAYLKDVKVAHENILDQLDALNKRLGVLEKKVLTQHFKFT